MISTRCFVGALMLCVGVTLAVAADTAGDDSNVVSDDEARLIVGGACGKKGTITCSDDPDGSCGAIAGYKAYSLVDTCNKPSTDEDDAESCGGDCGTYVDKTESCAK